MSKHPDLKVGEPLLQDGTTPVAFTGRSTVTFLGVSVVVLLSLAGVCGLRELAQEPASSLASAPLTPAAAATPRSSAHWGRPALRMLGVPMDNLQRPVAVAAGREEAPTFSRRALFTSSLGAALAAQLAVKPDSALAEAAQGAQVYFGNGCFWGRQHDFVEAEKRLGRDDTSYTSLVGYAGGIAGPGKDGKVCYYYGEPTTVYERLGHAEVVQVKLSDSPDQAAKDLAEFSKTYFNDFNQAPVVGMIRLDPQDAGPGYRNMIGLPGGINSPLMNVIKENNLNNMKLMTGKGNLMQGDKPSEGDLLNAVWIYDSNDLPFYPAEVYHQFHDGLGYRFPLEYTKELKKKSLSRGLIKETGCPELKEYGFANFEMPSS